MVIGNGIMAKTFESYNVNNNVLIFASGVSDSTLVDKFAFERERLLIERTINAKPDLLFVYFSTCSLEDNAVKNRPYNRHKLEIENYIKGHTKKYLIFRVSNVVGPEGNEKTIMNYLVNSISNDVKIDLWKNAERNLIDKDDVFQIVHSVIDSGRCNQTINIALAFSVKVTEIVGLIEKHLKKKANIKLLEKGNALNIDVSLIESEVRKIEDSKGVGALYINYLLKKYY